MGELAGQSDPATDVWLCPLCGWVDDRTRDIHCRGGHDGDPTHRPVMYAQVVRGCYVPVASIMGVTAEQIASAQQYREARRDG
jgi:hypothetical protein